MQTVHDTDALRLACAGLRARGGLALVPTMGNLHAGHIALVELARRHAPAVAVSVFVNPLQFGAGEDFGRYPRTLEADAAALRAAGTDLLFAPATDVLYPAPQEVFVAPPPLADELCGATRPGHFRGVLTVVLKLLNLVVPTHAVFGKKDYQQLHLVRRMVRDFNLPVAVVAGETVRASDGLALSSRNAYLPAAARARAPGLHAELARLRGRCLAGERDYAGLEAAAARALESEGWRVDYVAVRDADTLLPPVPGARRLVALAAARLEGTRLIDNLEWSGPAASLGGTPGSRL